MLFDVMVALMFIGVIALLLVGLVVLVVKKLLRVHKEEGGKPVATAKRVGVFALGGLAALAGAIGGAFKETNIVDNFRYNLVPDVDDVLNPCWDDFYLS